MLERAQTAGLPHPCRSLAARFAKNPASVDELLAKGWWGIDGDTYVIRHHATYQRLQKDVLAQQAANAANGRRGGRP